jgi:hypothetical protein
MNKYLMILLAGLSLSLISAQASAGYKCYTWKEHGVKYTKCYDDGRKCHRCERERDRHRHHDHDRGHRHDHDRGHKHDHDRGHKHDHDRGHHRGHSHRHVNVY